MSKPTLEHVFAEVQREFEEMNGTAEPCFTLDNFPVTPEEMADVNCGLPAFARQYIEFYDALFSSGDNYVKPAFTVEEVGADDVDENGVHAVIPVMDSSGTPTGNYFRVKVERELQWTDIGIISMTARLLTKNDLVSIANTPLDPSMLSQLSIVRSMGISRLLSPLSDEQLAENQRKKVSP